MGETKISCVYPRLQLAYLLQFAIWGSWNIALGGFLNSVHMPGWQIGYIFMAIPLGAIIAPMFIGPIADRFFSAQKVLGLLHLISGVALALCGLICLQGMKEGSVSFPNLMILMLLSGICYMPSIPLINTVVFKHLPNVSSAPRVFIFGTVGWILVNLVVEIFCEGATKPYFFFVGGGCGIFLGLYSFTLPNTPPKGAPSKGEKNDVLGLEALRMFKNPIFTMFVLCAFMVSIFGSNYYFPALVPYLSEHGYPAPLALGTLNQFSELFFMAILGFCVYRFGLKWVLVFGMSAWAVRYFLFTIDGFHFALIGLLLHGLAYAFLYTAAYMFGDRVAPPQLKASVQSLLAFLLLGIGQVLSGWIYGYQLDKCAPQLTGTVALATVQKEETITTTEKLIKTEAPKAEAPKAEVKKEAPKAEA
ncbi:MAG: MFS transporter, partial [Planctomycetia bacterium]|nr:MFS transporter [Planctomycetia bacterium]